MSDIPGSVYDIATATITRQLLAGEPLFRLHAPAGRLAYVLNMWFAVFGIDNLNETNAMQITNLSSLGAGAVLFSYQNPRDLNSGAWPGPTGAVIPNDGWTTDPTVGNKFGGAKPFNLGSGWSWSARRSGITQNIGLDIGGGGISCHLARDLSASMTCRAGLTVVTL